MPFSMEALVLVSVSLLAAIYLGTVVAVMFGAFRRAKTRPERR